MASRQGSSRLADSTSPYLLAHAGNPVDWWPWGEEAFAEARRRDVPVFVSVGYATCHWCHVMARESFSDPELAAYLNERFVAIKVDREEHPDVDAAMLAQAGAFTQNLGWPLSVFTTPEGGAFYAGTYFPPRAGQGVPAFREVLEAITDAWTQRRDEVGAIASALVGALAERRPAPDAEAVDLDAAADAIAALDDPEFGGLGRGPKFPNAPVLAFFAEHGPRELARRTLAIMAASPLRDPVDGGFFRYATQRDWTEPHYERMLGDNAQLLALAARLAPFDPGAERIATGIAGFLLDTLRLPSRAFASAQDSESDLGGSAARAAGTGSTRESGRGIRRRRSTARCSRVSTGSRSGRSPRPVRGSTAPSGSRPPPSRPTRCPCATAGGWCGPRSMDVHRMPWRPWRTTAAWPAACCASRSRAATCGTRSAPGSSSTRRAAVRPRGGSGAVGAGARARARPRRRRDAVRPCAARRRRPAALGGHWRGRVSRARGGLDRAGDRRVRGPRERVRGSARAGGAAGSACSAARGGGGRGRSGAAGRCRAHGRRRRGRARHRFAGRGLRGRRLRALRRAGAARRATRRLLVRAVRVPTPGLGRRGARHAPRRVGIERRGA
ncbi:thioredoxin domain-containing protein [Pseudolysinimonas kribbensis]|uniref:thioredoxin domain-containing protein n=1 Tax=Pseudolysinimonas kribbensis TaxID=433641 RepID=UPI0032AF15E5